MDVYEDLAPAVVVMMTDSKVPPAVEDNPIVELINDIYYCSPECPFLKEISMANGICLKDGEPLDFYDWYLSRCQEIDRE